MSSKKVFITSSGFSSALKNLAEQAANARETFAIYGKVSDEYIEDRSLKKINVSNLLPKRPLINISEELIKKFEVHPDLISIGGCLPISKLDAKLFSDHIEQISKTAKNEHKR